MIYFIKLESAEAPDTDGMTKNSRSKPVRGIIIASDISEDLPLATKHLPHVKRIACESAYTLHTVGWFFLSFDFADLKKS